MLFASTLPPSNNTQTPELLHQKTADVITHDADGACKQQQDNNTERKRQIGNGGEVETRQSTE